MVLTAEQEIWERFGKQRWKKKKQKHPVSHRLSNSHVREGNPASSSCLRGSPSFCYSTAMSPPAPGLPNLDNINGCLPTGCGIVAAVDNYIRFFKTVH